MPENNSRSPCVLLESAPAAQTGTELRETRRPDRAHLQLRQEARGDTTVTLLDVDVATVGKINRNGRLYPRSAWETAVNAAQPDLSTGRLWGLLEHPDDWFDPLKGELASICIRYETLTIDGDTVRATGVLIETAAGQDLKALVNGGIAVGISTNGTASVRYLPAKELDLPDYPDPEAYIAVIQDDFRLATIDAVSDPSDLAGGLRKKERQARNKEHTMNPKLKKLLEKLGMDEAAFKAEFPDQHAALTQEGTSPAAPSGEVNLDAYRTLEQTVVALNAKVQTLEGANLNAVRDGIVSTALEAAKLPSAGKVKHGETEIDLDASFRADLTQVARAAESDDQARQLVDARIAERRALVKPGAATPAPRNGVALPVGETSAVKSEAPAGTVRNTRASLGLS